MGDQQQSQLFELAQGGSAPNMSVNVLCLDGGGVRGLSSLLILRNLFQRLSYQSTSQKPLLPCDIFDIICGTSTGGVIALMLGRLRMSVDEAIDAYLDFSKTAFTKKKRVIIKPKYRYDASKLEEWIKKLVSEKELGGRTSLADPESEGCRTFVVAVSKAYADVTPKLFRTYATNEMPADDCEIWEAARATTAAFPFFEPATFGTPNSTYVDGQFSGSNNPSQLAIEEVENIFPSHKIGCFLSLGTGIPDDVVSIPQNSHGIADACKKLVESCEIVHDKTYKDFQRKALQNEYIRLSVDRGLGKIQLDEWQRSEDLTGITEGYLELSEVQERVTTCIEILKKTGMIVESII